MYNQSFSKIWIIVVLVSLVVGGVLAWQYWWTPKEEAKNEIANRETYRNGESEFDFQYPEDLDQTYIHTQVWPPKITVRDIDPNFVCEELPSVKTPLGYGSQKEVTINNTKYCVLTVREGAAGSNYASYVYTTIKDDKHLTLEFTLRFANCGNYAASKMQECETEQEAFNPNMLADEIISSFKSLK